MSPLVSNLREYILHARSMPLNQDKAEVRIYAALFTSFAGYFLIAEPLFSLIMIPQSPIYLVATLAPSHWCVVAAFLLCLVCMTPHLIILLFKPSSLGERWPRRLAAKASFGAAVTWIYLTNLSLPMDLGGIEWTYGLRALGALTLSFSYGYSCNAQQGREILDAKND